MKNVDLLNNNSSLAVAHYSRHNTISNSNCGTTVAIIAAIMTAVTVVTLRNQRDLANETPMGRRVTGPGSAKRT